MRTKEQVGKDLKEMNKKALIGLLKQEKLIHGSYNKDFTDEVKQFEQLDNIHRAFKIAHRCILVSEDDTIIDLNFKDVINTSGVMLITSEDKVTLTINAPITVIVQEYSTKHKLGWKFNKNVDFVYRCMLAIGVKKNEIIKESLKPCNNNTFFGVSVEEPISYNLKKWISLNAVEELT